MELNRDGLMVDVKQRRQKWRKNFGRDPHSKKRKQQLPPVELASSRLRFDVPSELVVQINVEIANYNRDRNPLSLWIVLTICLENQIPVPEGVDDFFLNISRKLVGYARQGEPQARQFISDLVLGTTNEAGGRGVFASFLNAEKEREIVRRTNEIIIQQIDCAFPEQKSLDAVYEIVADEFGVEPEHVKKLVRLYEGDPDGLDVRALFKAVNSPPQIHASGLDTTVGAEPDDDFEEPSDGILSHGTWKVTR